MWLRALLSWQCKPEAWVGINAEDIGWAVQIEITAVALEVDIGKKAVLCENQGEVC